jgi:hypothetical protein
MISIILTSLGVAALYLYHVNSAMKRVPNEARKRSPHRWTVDDVKAAYKKALENPIDITDSLPPKQSRRYIVVGGSGKWDSCTFHASFPLLLLWPDVAIYSSGKTRD